uniref:Uncharacterized protein n=1 Tax=Lotus japonicus TaxID=34305 RepID=I3SS11_LOTJA|nr:unknown [Lotus japonicus]
MGEKLGDLIWIAGGGARRTVEDGEGAVEDGREREVVVDAAGLDLAVDGSESAAGDGAVREGGRRWCHIE